MDTELSTPELICPPADANHFTVGGVTYTATTGLSVARMRVFQRYMIEFGTDTSLRGLVDGLDKAWGQLNKLELAAAAHTLGQLRDGINVIGTARLRSVELCALFFNAPGEDPTTYEHAAMVAKIDAWGAVHSGFFTVRSVALLSASADGYPQPPEEPERHPANAPTPAAP